MIPNKGGSVNQKYHQKQLNFVNLLSPVYPHPKLNPLILQGSLLN